MTRTSKNLAAVEEDRRCSSDPIRFSTISAGLCRSLKSSKRGLLEHFERHATLIGKTKHVLSLFCNMMCINDPKILSGHAFGKENALKNFYYNAWSSLEAACGTSEGKGKGKAYFVQAKQFLSTYDEGGHIRSSLQGGGIPVDCRQHECVEMATAANEMLMTVDTRMKRYFVSYIAFQKHSNLIDVKDHKKMATAMYSRCLLRAGSDVPLIGIPCIDDEIERHRNAMGDLISSPPKTEDGAEPSGTQFDRARAYKKYCYLLIPYLKFLSDAALQLLPDQSVGNKCDEALDTEYQDDCDDEPDDEECTECSPCNSSDMIYSKQNYPKPFSILPISRLRPAMVYWGYTELDTMISNLRRQIKKRKRESGAKDARQPQYLSMLPEVGYGTELFNFKHIKGKKHADRPENDRLGRGWRLCCFRTDGITVHFTFASGLTSEAPHVSELVKTGYSIAEPAEKVDIGTVPRGVFRVRQSRCDMKVVGDENGIELAACDPGFNRPVQWAKIPLSECHDVESIAERSQHWHVNNDDWMLQSGRAERDELERKRRRINHKYSESIDALSSTRRKCADSSVFGEYVQESIRTLLDRSNELVTQERAAVRKKYRSKLLSWLDRVADDGMGRSTLRYERHCVDDMANVDREKLVKRLNDAREARRLRKRVVFFGDGTFSSSHRGSVSIPKKKLVKQLAVRGLTFLLDEYNTSKYCPCGEILCDVCKAEGVRVRAHKANGGECTVLRAVKDRDELATVNMLLAASKKARGAEWPAHLLRPSTVT